MIIYQWMSLREMLQENVLVHPNNYKDFLYKKNSGVMNDHQTLLGAVLTPVIGGYHWGVPLDSS